MDIDVEQIATATKCHLEPEDKRSTKATTSSSQANLIDLPKGSNNSLDHGLEFHGRIQPTLKRYIILFLFCVNSATKAYQWIQISAVTNKLTSYYQVDNYTINLTSIVFLVAFLVLSLPACCMIKVIGLRKAVIVASFATALGSIVKCFSLADRYGIKFLFLGQALVACGEQFIFSIPNRMISVWFPDHELSGAMSICVLGNQFGVVIGFLIPQYLLGGANTFDEINHGLDVMFTWTAVVAVASFLADVVLFDEAPAKPPGMARLKQIEQEAREAIEFPSPDGKLGVIKFEISNVIKILGKLFHNKDLMLLNLSYLISIGIVNAVPPLLDQTLQLVWPGDSILVGYTGVAMIIVGAFGSPLIGRSLDKTHRYLLANRLLALGATLSLAAFGWAVCYSGEKWTIYVTAGLIGLCQVGMMVAVMELAVELTYPSPEMVTSSLMNLTPMVSGIFFCLLGSYVVDTMGALAVSVFWIVIQLLALLVLVFVTEDLKRQRAAKNLQPAENPIPVDL